MGKQIIVGITIGDPNGIGPEIIIKTFNDNRLLDFITPVIYSPKNIIKDYVNLLQCSVDFKVISNLKNIKNKNLYIFDIPDKSFKISPGKNCKEAGEISFKSLELATESMIKNQLDVIITAPINKSNIQNKSFNFKGHTEYFTSLANVEHSLMLMVHQDLRVALVTNHLPLKNISNALNDTLIKDKARLFNNSLIKDFGIQCPKIALLGLNPHCSDDGLIGNEEGDIIIPAIEQLNKEGLLVYGPFPTDGFFANGAYQKFDGILAMYHDQGLAPFKIISQNQGVNFTAGLPIIRTSPDHGTAYNIAGNGIADENSFRNAIYTAIDIYKKRSN